MLLNVWREVINLGVKIESMGKTWRRSANKNKGSLFDYMFVRDSFFRRLQSANYLFELGAVLISLSGVLSE